MRAYVSWLSAAGIFSVCFSLPAFAQSADFNILGGTEGGAYYAMAHDISRLYEKYCGKKLNVLPSNGSFDNVTQMDSRRPATLGFVHSDTLDYLTIDAKAKGEMCKEACRKARSNVKDLRYVFPVYAAEVHLLAHRNSGITSIEDLRGKRVSLGPDGSGTQKTALTLLSTSSPPIRVVEGDETDPRRFTKMLPKEQLSALSEGKIDAFFWVTGQPVEPLTARDGKCSERLKDISLVTLSIPLKLRNVYNKATIEYPCITPEEIDTFSVSSILVTYNFTENNGYMLQRCKDVAVISHLIWKHLKELQTEENDYHGNWKGLTEENIFKAEVEGWGKNACVSKYETLPFQEELVEALRPNPVEGKCIFDEYCLQFKQGASVRQLCEIERTH